MPVSATSWLGKLVNRLAPLLPSCCALCGSLGRSTLCDACQLQFFGSEQQRCLQCAAILPRSAETGRCGNCLRHLPAFDASIAAADYAPPIDQLLLALKFGNQLALSILFARQIQQAIQRTPVPLPEVLLPVPLGKQRLTARGFNQALEIARPLAKALGISIDAGLAVRLHETGPQALLPLAERNHNIRSAFIVPHHAQQRIRGRHIGVVDDVMTTGATLNELAATLKRFGAARVTNLVFARTVLH